MIDLFLVLDLSWSPKLCDIPPLNFFLWGFKKSKVFADKPTAIEALEANITRVIREMTQMLKRVIKNWTLKTDELKRSYGQDL